MRKLISFLLFIPLLYSCSSPRYVYFPAPPNNPYFKEKGETKLAAYYSGNENSTCGYDLQAAYAVAKNWALTTSYSGRRDEDDFDARNNYYSFSDVKYKRSLLEFGGGYFKSLNKRNSIFFTIYGGLGFGKFSFDDTGKDKNGADYARIYSSKMTKWFFQPAINFQPGKYVRLSLISKISFARYHHISTSYIDEELEYFDLNKLPGKTFNFFEPACNMQVGLTEWMAFNAGFSFVSAHYENTSNIRSRSLGGSIGLSFDLFKIKSERPLSP